MNRFAKETSNLVLILAGVACAAMGLKGFLFSSKFIDGGVTGISMLLADLTSAPLAFWIPAINLPFIALAFYRLGPAFAARSVFAISALATVLVFAPFPDVTPDRLLTAV